jgi:hypothetical protein
VSEAVPWVGVEAARFGESRSDLRARLGEFIPVSRAPEDTPIDHYASLGLLLHFDRSDLLDSIEVTSVSDLTVFGIRIFGRAFGDVLEDLRPRNISAEMDDSGCSVPGFGFSLYTPAPDELDFHVEGVALYASEGNSVERDGQVTDLPDSPGETLF